MTFTEELYASNYGNKIGQGRWEIKERNTPTCSFEGLSSEVMPINEIWKSGDRAHGNFPL